MADSIDRLLNDIRPYVPPTCTYIAAVGFFMSGQSRIAPLFTGKKQQIQTDNSDDGLIPMLSNLGFSFSSNTASTIIGAVKIALTIGLIYVPTRRDAARAGIAYTALGLISRLHQGITPSPPLINMALLAIPAQLFQ